MSQKKHIAVPVVVTITIIVVFAFTAVTVTIIDIVVAAFTITVVHVVVTIVNIIITIIIIAILLRHYHYRRFIFSQIIFIVAILSLGKSGYLVRVKVVHLHFKHEGLLLRQTQRLTSMPMCVYSILIQLRINLDIAHGAVLLQTTAYLNQL